MPKQFKSTHLVVQYEKGMAWLQRRGLQSLSDTPMQPHELVILKLADERDEARKLAQQFFIERFFIDEDDQTNWEEKYPWLKVESHHAD